MAKTSMIQRENKRARLIKKYTAKRAELRAIVNSQDASFDEKMEAQKKLQMLPRDSAAARRRNIRPGHTVR